jgi:hypothetical protein
LAYPSANTLHNLLVVAVVADNANPIVNPTISDTQGNTWNAVPGITGESGRPTLVWYAMDCKAGANTVSISAPGSADNRITVTEYSGVALTAALDQVGDTTGSGTSVASPAVTTTQAAELIIGIMECDGTTPVAGSGFTMRESDNVSGFEDKIVAATGSYTATFTCGGGGWGASIITFKAKTAPAVGLSATSLNFGNVNVGASASQDVTLTNTGDATLNISGLAGSGDYTVANSGSAVVAAGDTRILTVTFTPTTTGTRTGTITITDDAADSPQTIACTGVGVAAAGGGSGWLGLNAALKISH